MPWNQLCLDVPEELKDAIIGELSEQGSGGVWESGEPAPGHVHLIAYFHGPPDLQRINDSVSSIFNRTDRTPPRITQSSVEERDWTEEWKKSFTSFPIGSNFFIIPSWSDSVCPDGRLPIRIDPGQAFGTGTHETTQLTLEALERWSEPDQVVLDLGTGSGILAIACRILGTRCVVACDNDPVATEVARENIERNVPDGVWTVCGSIDAVREGCLDLLLCNLTADLIVRIFEDIHRAVRDSGLAIFSGILTAQRAEVLEVMRSVNFVVEEERTRGEWLVLVARKHVA